MRSCRDDQSSAPHAAPRHSCEVHRCRTIVGARFCATAGERSQERAPRPAAGFTLLEIVLVLAVMAVIIGVTYPPVMRYVGEQEVRGAAVEVRTEFAGTRIKAINSGLVYQFRYEPGGRWYAVLPFDRPDTGSGQSSRPASGLSSITPKSPPTSLRQLPESCRFRLKPGQTVGRIPDEWLQLLPSNAPLGTVSWSEPIFFFLDGTSDNATVIVEDQKGRSHTLRLRGVTGGVELGPLERGTPR